ncbi:uncharacterized protein LOC131323388 isoform X4 [Rhododendron vialii]|uniref:uncharacterized protein LOC131323388 isoform X4 n=1 Tax=Rhododendron vialii TaxID=182163 RepID=UPI00265EDC0D|nr:uncharacterized protein LOC131323388 isoform X4 [Rhododendron vialii]
MDLKFKGKKWVGNIYQKFEAICHEVDDFVSQDTVKYVENQVHTVGDSVKRFYADVVQDIIPSSMGKPGKHEAQAVCSAQNNTIETPVRSMIALEENPVYTNINQSSVEEYPIYPLKNTHQHLIPPPSANQVKLAELDLSLGPEFNALNDKKFHTVLEEKDTKEELVDKKSDILVEANDTEKAVIDEKSLEVVEENGAKEEPSQPEEFELICTENKNVNEALLLSEYITEKSGIQSEVPTATLLCSTQKENVDCINFLDDVECVSNTSSLLTPSEMSSSVVSSESRIPEVGLISTSSSLSIATHVLFCDNKDTDMGLTKVADMGLTFSGSALSLESKAEDAASLAGSSANTHCYECAQLEVLMSSLEIGEADNCRVDITDPSLESIELSEMAKPDEGCVVLGRRLLYADSCRAQRHRSYKKILQDAFASKKRISKEYEQLGIQYGDIDIGSIQQQPLNLLPPSSTLDSKKSSSQETWEPEWELL